MKPTSTHHEILLFTGTNIASRQLTGKEENGNTKPCTSAEELEKACWNGMLHEMFPEIFGGVYSKYENYVWHALAGKSFLYITIGPFPVIAEHDTSIDPYFYINSACEN